MTAAITDADRELFIDLFTPGWKHPESSHRWEVTSGGMDDDPRMQALAAHRIQARKEAIEEAATAAHDAIFDLAMENNERPPAAWSYAAVSAIRALAVD